MGKVFRDIERQREALTCEEEDRLLWEARRLEICFLGLAKGTRASYRCQLRRLDAWLERRELTHALLARYLLYRHRGAAERGVNKLAPGSLRTIVSAARWRADKLDRNSPVGRETESVLKHARRDGSAAGGTGLPGRGRGVAPGPGGPGRGGGPGLSARSRVLRQLRLLASNWPLAVAHGSRPLLQASLREAKVENSSVGHRLVKRRKNNKSRYGVTASTLVAAAQWPGLSRLGRRPWRYAGRVG